MKIAIVDDIKSDRDILRAKITAHLDDKKIPFELREFASAEELLAVFVPKAYDVVFLDIYMDGISGITAAQEIYRQDYNCKLIFLTSAPQHWKESFGVRAVFYLVKPIDDKDFREAMTLAEVKEEYDVPLLTVLYKKVPMKLDTGKILYIEYRDRQTFLHLWGETLAVSGSFSEVTDALQEDRRFLFNVRGMMVNMEYVMRCDGEWFYLQNGERQPVGVRNKAAIVDAYRNFQLATMRREGTL